MTLSPLFYDEPKLVFRMHENGNPLALQFAIAHYPGCFTQTGMKWHHILPIEEWCKENNCGDVIMGSIRNHCEIHFENEPQLAMFLLRWK